jgi:hypothetical protein
MLFALLALGLTAVVLGASTTLPDEETPEGRDPTHTELLAAVRPRFLGRAMHLVIERHS